jgi:hypothetical protein
MTVDTLLWHSNSQLVTECVNVEEKYRIPQKCPFEFDGGCPGNKQSGSRNEKEHSQEVIFLVSTLHITPQRSSMPIARLARMRTYHRGSLVFEQNPA